MLFGKKESPVISIAKALAVPALTILGSGCAAYFGARKGVTNTVEECAVAPQKVVPTYETLITKAEAAEAATPAAPAPAESEELAKYKEAIKKLMAEKAELEKAAAAKAEAKAAETPKKEKKADKKSEAPKAGDKDDVKTESQAEAK